MIVIQMKIKIWVNINHSKEISQLKYVYLHIWNYLKQKYR